MYVYIYGPPGQHRDALRVQALPGAAQRAVDEEVAFICIYIYIYI